MTHFAVAIGVLERRTLEGYVLLPPGDGNPIALDATASAFWSRLRESGPICLEDLVSAVGFAWRDAPSEDEVATAARALLLALAKRGAVTSVP